MRMWSPSQQKFVKKASRIFYETMKSSKATISDAFTKNKFNRTADSLSKPSNDITTDLEKHGTAQSFLQNVSTSTNTKPPKISMEYTPQRTMNIQQDAFEIKYSADRACTLNFVENQEATSADEDNFDTNDQKDGGS